MLIISEKDFDNLANCITELCKIFGNIATTKESDERHRKDVLHFVKGGNAYDDIGKKEGQK